MKFLKFVRELIAVIAGLVALFQMFYSNERRAEENVATCAQVQKLAEKVDEQNARIEAAFFVDSIKDE